MSETPAEGGVRLREYRDDDVRDVAAGYGDPLAQRYLPELPSPFTREHADWWVREGAPAAFRSGGCAYAVADPVTDRLIGGVGLDRVVPLRQQAEVGYWTAPWARGRGVATAAVRELARRAFAEGRGRLELLTEWPNVASQRVALAAGFHREGVRRSAMVTRAGVREDLVVFARAGDDPPGPVVRLLPDLPGGELTDGVVTLRPLLAADLPFHVDLHLEPDVVATTVPPVAPEREQLRRRCVRAAGQWLAGERADLVIADAATGAPTGEIGLFYDDPRTGQAMIGYSMSPAWRRRGYPTRAVELLSLWAFAETGVARLIAGTLPDNTGSQRVLEKAGFRREAYLRARLPGPDGRRVDDVQYVLLATDVLARST